MGNRSNGKVSKTVYNGLVAVEIHITDLIDCADIGPSPQQCRHGVDPTLLAGSV
jgi:hypothetical protein